MPKIRKNISLSQELNLSELEPEAFALSTTPWDLGFGHFEFS